MSKDEARSGARILLIDDDAGGRDVAAFVLKKAGYEVTVAASGEEGLEYFADNRPDLAITDLRLPGVDGLGVLEQIKDRAPSVPVVMITGYADVDIAVQAMKLGAYDFIGKPLNRDHLVLVVARALERLKLRQEVSELRARVDSVERPIVTRSPGMLRLLDIVDRVAQGTASVLITGETGTGKELIARRIHARSPVSAGPFVALSCAAIPPDLLESELFGHEKGAFTGATRARRGRFREASGGSLFLDEIGELPISLQAKLLRVLQERSVDVVGKDKPEEVSVRVIAATNQDLACAVEAGTFRSDLLYRLNVVELHVPPLRERVDDIAQLTNHFVKQFAEGRDLKIPVRLVQELTTRSWPGNVRQLQNVCERLVLLAQGDTLSVDDLPQGQAVAQSTNDTGQWPPLPPEGLSLIDLEKRVIERALAYKRGNVSQTAQYLRIPRHVLAYRLDKYGIPH